MHDVFISYAHEDRALARDEWHQYLGDQPYRATCANLEPEGER
jgi:hypothetical protein